MSVSPRRVWSFHVATVLIPAAILVSGGCHHAPSAEPVPAENDPLRQFQLVISERERTRFSGVDLVPTRFSGFLVKIHSGMVGDGEPLYVIDGAPIMVPADRGIDWFKPEDISQIKVLKYPHELAEYGPNGVNGVIVITTKQAAGRSRGR